MTRRRARNLRATAWMWALSSSVSTALQGNRTPDNVVANVVLCLAVSLTVAAIYRRFLPRLRALPLVPAALVAGLALLGGVAGALLAVVWLLVAIHEGGPFAPRVGPLILRTFVSGGGWRGILYAFGLVLAITLLVELSRRLGTQRLASLLLGRYRHPQEEVRTFLLIDLRDSTPLAERLGAVAFSALLRDLFRDLTEPVVDAGGEVVGYVGDEAIVSWRARDEPAEAVRCFAALRARLAARAGEYERRYGAAPRIKGAVHRGPVVVTEVGELRTDVAFLGDALNTASRILDECGPLGADLLVSGPAAEGLLPIPGLRLEPLGAFPLRGKGEPLPLVRAAFDPTP